MPDDEDKALDEVEQEDTTEDQSSILVPVPVGDAVMELLRASHHMSRELKPLWDRARIDGIDPGVGGGPLADSFVWIGRWTAVANDTPRPDPPPTYLFVIPASDLPDYSFDWVIEGSGVGHVFLTNYDLPGIVTPTSGAPAYRVDLEDPFDSGIWFPVASVSMTSTMFIDDHASLIRMSPQGNIANYIWHYDPDVDDGIRFGIRMLTNTGGFADAFTLNIGLHGQIIKHP